MLLSLPLFFCETVCVPSTNIAAIHTTDHNAHVVYLLAEVVQRSFDGLTVLSGLLTLQCRNFGTRKPLNFDFQRSCIYAYCYTFESSMAGSSS